MDGLGEMFPAWSLSLDKENAVARVAATIQRLDPIKARRALGGAKWAKYIRRLPSNQIARTPGLQHHKDPTSPTCECREGAWRMNVYT